MKRREFLVLSATSIGGVLIYSLDGVASHRDVQAAPTEAQTVRIPLQFFTRAEAIVIAALAARIFPNDESGPGASEAGVVIYIDRQLAGPYGRDLHRYTQGPFEEGLPEQGYQGSATPQQVYRAGLKPLLGIERQSSAEQDKALQEIETTLFFRYLRTHTIEGMFCDPLHGGNADMIGWQLIGFPGPRMSYLNDIDQHYGEGYRPKPVDLRQLFGDKVSSTEEDR
jgi:gluconate 2-dehydrogenase gamma chain